MSDCVDVACALHALPREVRERHLAQTQALKAAALETSEVERGLAIRLDPARVTLAELAEWIEDERRCCPFLAFRLDLAPQPGPLWLTLQGPEGTREMLKHELGL